MSVAGLTYMAWLLAVALPVALMAALIARSGRRVVASPVVGAPLVRTTTRPRIVIVGGGFAGIYTARRLERSLGGREDFEIVLVSRENYFVFQPMLPEVISGAIGIVDTVSPIRRLLPRTELHVREVESIDLARRVVITSAGFEPHSDEIQFDHLVLALGNVTDFRGLPGLPEHAMPFKNLADALALRTHIIRALEEAAIERHDPELRRRLLTFVIAGGGFSGVEVAAEINDFVRAVARYYRGIDPSEIRVVLLHSRERILPEVSEKLARFAERMLTKRGVELRLKSRLAAATADGAILSSGEHLATKTLVSTIPASPHPILEALDLPKEKNGRIRVDRFLRVDGHENLWALGDCAWVTTPDGATSPLTAQHATRQAEIAATNLLSAVRGGRQRPFDFAGLGKMGSLGHRSAVAEVMGMQLSGFLAWFLWRTVYLAKLPGWGRRIKVAVSWTLDLFLPPDLVELRLSRSKGMMHEHFEPGQIVFRQGELGDRLFIILAGNAEVVREHDGVETVLARLGPGKYFGEIALLEHEPRNATIRCVSPMNTVSIPKSDFGTLTAYLPALRESFEVVARTRQEPPTGEQPQRAPM